MICLLTLPVMGVPLRVSVHDHAKLLGVANFSERHLRELLSYAKVKPAVNQGVRRAPTSLKGRR